MIIICATCTVTAALGAPSHNKKDQRFMTHLRGLPYITVSGGAGILTKSWQPGMSPRFIPFSFLAEYGRTSYPISIVAGTIIRNTYTLDRFLLNPNNFFGGIQYSPFTGKEIGQKFNVYCMAGLGLSYARFTEEINPGVINYEYKVEKKTGAGLAAGIGAGYRIKKFEIRPCLFYFTGQADFFAGHFSKQHFDTGSMQLHLMISYRFILNPDNRSCPVYHKNRRI